MNTPTQAPSKEKLEFQHHAVVDRNGVVIQMPDLRTARHEAKLWNKQHSGAAPHRVVEVLLREVTE